MRGYRLYWMDSSPRIRAVRDLFRPNDDAGDTTAYEFAQEQPHLRHPEIWCGPPLLWRGHDTNP
jgi:hypothetical protein